MNNIGGEQKHFKVIYGKVLGIPVGSATPITPQGHKILSKYLKCFIPLCFLGVFGTHFIKDSNFKLLLFMACWISAFVLFFLFTRQLKKTGEFERQYFFKKPD